MTRVLTLVLVLGGAVVGVAGEQSLSVSIAVPSDSDGRRVEYRDPTSHFHVVLSNASSRPQRVWQDCCSWGYYALSFELVDESGTKWVAKRAQTGFTVNYPAYWTLGPGEAHVFDVYFGDDTQWEGFRLPIDRRQERSLTAIFEVSVDKEAVARGAWTGRVVSRRLTISFARWTKPEK
jgi:hypothetical protein